MVKSLLVAAAMIVSVGAQAQGTLAEGILSSQTVHIQEAIRKGLDWKVGDECDYKLNMGGFINGTMVMSITSIGDDGVWITQNLDLTIQKQEVKMLIDPSTGQIKKMLVNGQDQAVPKQDLKVVDQKQESVTVPAGTFDSIYLKVQDNANNGAISEEWVNPTAVPVSGMIKTIQDSQLGKVTIELTSFKH